MKHVFKALVVSTFLLLSGCIEIDDVSAMWKKGERDPALEGMWSYHNEQDTNQEVYFVKFTPEKDYYLVETFDKAKRKFTEADAVFYIKTLRTGKNAYMLTGYPQEPDKVNGMIWPYRIQGTHLVTTQLKTCASCTSVNDTTTPPRLKVLSDEILGEFDAVLAASPEWTPWMEGDKLP